jgi:hypothetical protein
MKPEELKELARKHLDFAIEQIRTDGDCMMQFGERMRDGALRLFVFDGSAANDRKAKAAFGKRIRQDVAAGECVATLLVSDTFFAENLTPEKNKIRAAFGWDIEQAAAAGLCEKREAVTVNAEMRGYVLTMRQEYKRNGREVTLVGEPRVYDSANARLEVGQANLSGFFSTPAANAARN